MAQDKITLSDHDFNRLQQTIYQRSGIHFQISRKYVLESRLSRRLTELGFDNFSQYILYLTTGPYQDDEFQEMFNRITINETSFFRNEPQLQHFETRMLPALLQRRQSSRQLRIWSAACSSGEEPYSLAMQLHRKLGGELAKWSVDILGTDISQKVLDVAQAGTYSEYSVRSVVPTVLARYFKQEDRRYQLDPAIRKMVRFQKLNLKDRFAARRLGIFDVIFCRNVLIYFDGDMKAHCANLFHDQLANDGVLMLGHSETLRDIDTPLTSTDVPHAFAYMKAPYLAKQQEGVACVA